MAYSRLPRLTTHIAAGEFRPLPDALYVYGSNDEARSDHISSWEPRVPSVEFVEIVSSTRAEAAVRSATCESNMLLRSRKAIQQVLREARHRQTYVDITGLPHHVWAPIVRVLIEDIVPRCLKVIYAEPAAYHKVPTAHAGLYELSAKLDGIAPLPMFTTLSSSSNDSVVVPMLGFEGSRLRHLLEALEPPDNCIIPVIGVPGYRHPYPSYSILGNRHTLEENFRFTKCQFAKSHCAFDAGLRLLKIAKVNPDARLQIAPIGTRPHALAAVLFAIANPDRAEIVYDHPVGRPDRTVGTGPLCIFPLDGFVQALRLQ